MDVPTGPEPESAMPGRPLPVAATWGRLQTLLAVLDEGSVRGAADRLLVTPPAVSAAITALDHEFGTRLFLRSGRGIEPTPAARALEPYARTLLGLLEEAGNAVRAADRSRVRIGAVSTAAEFVLPRLLASFRHRYPDVEVSLSVQPRDVLFTALGHHEVDLVVAGRPPAGSHLVSRARRANELVVVCAGDLPGDPDIAGSVWLLRAAGSGTLQATRSLFEDADIDPPTLSLGTHGAVVAAAREGLGLTLVHRDAVAADLEAGRLRSVPVPGTPLARPWHIVTGPNLAQGAALVIDHVCNAALGGSAAFRRPRLR